MFTGIVQGLRPVTAVHPSEGLTRIEVDLADLADDLALGASVAINGTCLTVTGVDSGRVGFDVVAETLRLTNLGELVPGDLVNVERSARVGDEIGGHGVSGHVTSTATVLSVARDGGDVRLTLGVPAQLTHLLFHKGFVALDGCSLTIAGLDRQAAILQVALIPETLERTRFGTLAVGARVNLEIDPATQAIVETVQRLLADPDWTARLGLAGSGAGAAS